MRDPYEVLGVSRGATDEEIRAAARLAGAEEFIEKLHNIEDQEDIWFACLDHKKWDTYDIVCKKRYLTEE